MNSDVFFLYSESAPSLKTGSEYTSKLDKEELRGQSRIWGYLPTKVNFILIFGLLIGQSPSILKKLIFTREDPSAIQQIYAPFITIIYKISSQDRHENVTKRLEMSFYNI